MPSGETLSDTTTLASSLYTSWFTRNYLNAAGASELYCYLTFTFENEAGDTCDSSSVGCRTVWDPAFNNVPPKNLIGEGALTMNSPTNVTEIST